MIHYVPLSVESGDMAGVAEHLPGSLLGFVSGENVATATNIMSKDHTAVPLSALSQKTVS